MNNNYVAGRGLAPNKRATEQLIQTDATTPLLNPAAALTKAQKVSYAVSCALSWLWDADVATAQEEVGGAPSQRAKASSVRASAR